MTATNKQNCCLIFNFIFVIIMGCFILSFLDESSEGQHSGSDLPYPNLQLLSERLVGSPDEETVCWGVNLPLETQKHQDWLRQQPERDKKGEMMEQTKGKRLNK